MVGEKCGNLGGNEHLLDSIFNIRYFMSSSVVLKSSCTMQRGAEMDA